MSYKPLEILRNGVAEQFECLESRGNEVRTLNNSSVYIKMAPFVAPLTGDRNASLAQPLMNMELNGREGSCLCRVAPLCRRRGAPPRGKQEPAVAALGPYVNGGKELIIPHPQKF